MLTIMFAIMKLHSHGALSETISFNNFSRIKITCRYFIVEMFLEMANTSDDSNYRSARFSLQKTETIYYLAAQTIS